MMARSIRSISRPISWSNQLGMIEHVVEREEASHEHFLGGDPAPASVPGAERTVDAAPVDPAHAADADDAAHVLFGGQGDPFGTASCPVEGLQRLLASSEMVDHVAASLLVV